MVFPYISARARVVRPPRGLPIELPPRVVGLEAVLGRFVQQPRLELRGGPTAELGDQRPVVAAHEDDPET